MTRIAYLVHNLADMAVARRISMLRAAGADVVVAGFCRSSRAPEEIAGAAAISLGKTHDAKLGQRAFRVLQNLLRGKELKVAVRGADVVIARNLEMLVLAVAASKPGQRVVYESLDIHRSLLGVGLPSRALRWLERNLARRCELLIYSSPAFRREYFAKRQKLIVPAILVENKLLQIDGAPGAHRRGQPVAGPPWRIGWFGNLRCSRTLRILTNAAEQANGAIEIVIAGKASPAEFPDFHAAVSRPHVSYLGPYRPEELERLYSQCHFAWAIDFFEEGLNSKWLLPNKLYEAASFGTVPIALADVETGLWLMRHEAGLILRPGEEESAWVQRLLNLDASGYAALRAAIDAIPRSDLVAGSADCRILLEAVCQ